MRLPASLLNITITALLLCSTAYANHGPGTSGGGSSTASGETMKPGAFDLSIREDYTEFEHISRQEAERRAAVSGNFDALERSLVTTFHLSYGVVEDFEAGISIGYYSGDNFYDADRDSSGAVESGAGDPNGMTDLRLTGKYRVLKGAPGNLALIAGVKFPTGRDHFHLDNGEQIEPSSQPGSGSYDFQAGIAYSRFLTSHITIDTSALWTFRTQHEGFQVGDRLDLGLAVAYRLNDTVKSFPNVSVFGEVLGVILQKDRDHDEYNNNSGGSTMYLSPGVRIRCTPNISITAAPAFPVVQELNGDQIHTKFKMALTVSISF
jgi:hypothetical protein